MFHLSHSSWALSGVRPCNESHPALPCLWCSSQSSSYFAMWGKSVVAGNVADDLCVAERKSIIWLSLEIFTSLAFTFYPIGSVCLIESFSLGQNQSDRHEISVYTEKLFSFLFSCLSKLNTWNFSHLQHACPAGMLLVQFAEKWCWIKEHNSSLGILHFPYPWLIIKDFSSI